MFKQLMSAAALAVGVSAQVVTYSGSGFGLSVNVPANTASTGSGPIYIQMKAPSGVSWFAFGQGTMMKGANMFVMYTDGNGNVTVSPRTASGHVMPSYNSAAQITVLEGTQSSSDGSMTANIRCDSCLSWSGGSMSATSSSSNWIMAYKSGSALGSSSKSQSIQQHDYDNSNVQLDLTKGTGGSSANPFVQSSTSSGSSASASASAGTSNTATAAASGSSTVGASTSTAASQPAASSGSSNPSTISRLPTSNTPTIRAAHGVIMSLLFLILFPSIALTLYLPYAQRVRYIHGPLQALSTLLLIVGMAMGIILGQRLGELNMYHQIIGFLVVGILVLFQPALGIFQHLHYHRTGGRSAMGVVHRWLGRCMILLGVINGGLGFLQAGPVGNTAVPTWSVVLYSILAVLMAIIYGAVLLMAKRRGSGSGSPVEKYDRTRDGYEMHSSSPVQQHRGFGQSQTYQMSREYK